MKSKSKKPNPVVGFFLKPASKPSHKKRNATIAIVIGSALVTGLTKKKDRA